MDGNLPVAIREPPAGEKLPEHTLRPCARSAPNTHAAASFQRRSPFCQSVGSPTSSSLQDCIWTLAGNNQERTLAAPQRTKKNTFPNINSLWLIFKKLTSNSWVTSRNTSLLCYAVKWIIYSVLRDKPFIWQIGKQDHGSLSYKSRKVWTPAAQYRNKKKKHL